MKTLFACSVVALIPMILIGCSSGEGPDSISSHKPLKGGVISSCLQCHSSATSASLDPLVTNGSGTLGKHVIHVTERGIACERCHLNYMNSATHANGRFETGIPGILLVNFDIVGPAGAWVNDTGPRTGQCSAVACHGTDTLDWYGTGGWTLPACATCHSSVTGTRRQVVGAGGDFSKESHHVIDYASKTSEIVTDADCEVCHDMGNHTSGTIRLKDKDNAGQIIVYQPSNPASLEPFCLSCHDSDGATTEASPLKPFSSPSTLGSAPNIVGMKIKESWGKQYGHRRKGLTCLGNGLPGTGCHGNYNSGTGSGSINAHGSGNSTLLSNNYALVIAPNTWDDARYKLCMDCHRSYPSVLTIEQLAGVADGGNYAQPLPYYSLWPHTVDFMVTGFHDYYSYGADRQYNLHLYHLYNAMGSWYPRGSGISFGNGALSCVACHNVHGVDGQYYSLWDEWGFFIENDAGTEYGRLTTANFSISYPAFCAFTCHWDGKYRYPRSPFNEAKAVASRATGTLVNGDTVTIYFSDSTNGPAIDELNINTVLTLSGGHSWVDADKGVDTGVLTAAWFSTSGKTNNVLTVTIFSADPEPNPTIAVGDSITFDLSTITDTTDNKNPVRGKMTLRGSP